MSDSSAKAVRGGRLPLLPNPADPYFQWEGICLRPVEEKDLEALRRHRNNEETWVHLTDPKPLMPADQRAWLEGLSGKSGRFFFIVFSAGTPFLGLIRMDEYDSQNRSIRVGADIALDWRGQGMGKAVYTAIKKYCFDYLNVHRVWLAVLETNAHAIRLYEGQGFKHEGRYRQAVFRNGHYVDYLLMSILVDEYRERVDKELKGQKA